MVDLSSPYHYMQLPREVIVGNGTLTRITEVTQRLGLSGSALIIAGPKSCEIAGQQTRTLLQQKGINADTLKHALVQLRQHKLRTALTLLGMVFGVGAVIAMLSIGEGAQQEGGEDDDEGVSK